MKLFLHFDVNKTIYMADPVSGKEADYVFQCALAEDPQYAHTWQSDLPAMTYYQYVYDYLHPEDKDNEALKGLRKKAIESFLEASKAAKHPQYQQMKARYDGATKILTQNSTHLLPGFYYLIEHLEGLKRNGDIEHFQIFIRTFGEDLDLVEEELDSQTTLALATRARFINGTYYIEPPDEEMTQRKLLTSASNQLLLDLSALYKYWQANPQSITIQDDHAYWAANQKQFKYAKPFPFDSQSSDTISIFFDDNIEKECGATNIVAPYDVAKKEYVPVSEILKEGLAYIVNPLEAVEQFNYFVSRVEQTRKAKELNSDKAKPILHQAKLTSTSLTLPDEDQEVKQPKKTLTMV